MISERKVYVDILEQQSLLKCQASSATWGCCTENAKFSFFSNILRQTVFLCAKHLTWILEEPEQQFSGELLKDYETIGKKKAAILERDPKDSNRPCMAVHAAGRRRGRVCGHLNTFCFYSFLFNNYIYLCRRHFLWIDGQIAHEVSFVKLLSEERQDEESTNGSLNFAANVSQHIALLPTADILLNTSPVTPTRTKEIDSNGTADIPDFHSFSANCDPCIHVRDITKCDTGLQRKMKCAEAVRNCSEERSISDMGGNVEEKTAIEDLKHAKSDSAFGEFFRMDKEFPLRYKSDTNLTMGNDVEQNFSNDKFSEDKIFEEHSCPVSMIQQLSFADKTRDEVSPSQLHSTLKSHVRGKLKSLQLKSENISRLLLHRGRPRSPTIDEHSTSSLPTRFYKSNDERSIKEPNIVSYPVSSEIKRVAEQESLDKTILEQSEESSAVSEKEDPSSLNVAARTVLDPHLSEADNVTRTELEVPYSVNGHEVTLTTQFSETKFSTTEEGHDNNTIAVSPTAIPVSFTMERNQHNDACCCTIS
ncbi:uncharacterized protein Gasu_56130 [Galdieria sulphuraria]|uniref:Uncharacterized protein n=1 Tax=Galdieria sulphuraria TaxID=130081 RepID=M2XTT6_GALSU|nr:uncharacterized protein Gasu_56130 [Galdieria sulphuraria]EME26824.1 hypothetical protein Gasu_56130 [Galdieria sulphuraria]|eukprot:XP_005703344.1 hypothetical protein Gasu_56130 [Galdieria sulphuraria]